MRIAALFMLSLTGCAPPAAQEQQASPRPSVEEPPVQGARVVRTYPHDPGAFTQGLIWLDGRLFESTGLVGASTIREVELDTGRVVRSINIPPGLFGEGLVNWGDELRSITWQDGIGFRWDRATFRQTGMWRYDYEGWGLTQDGRSIIMSDGTPTLRFLDPGTMREVRHVTVTAGGQPVAMLNELEYVNGEIFANIWQTTRIARIDPASGRVTAWIDLAPLVAQSGAGTGNAVLNGIAWDAQRNRLFVTGKLWPHLYEIALLPPQPRR